MRRLLWFLAILSAAVSLAQQPTVVKTTSDPTGLTCTPGTSRVLVWTTNGKTYFCNTITSQYEQEAGGSSTECSLTPCDLDAATTLGGDPICVDSGSGCGGGGGAPTTATYILQTAEAGLDNAQALGALNTGILKSATGTGVVSIAISGTDYAAGSHTHAGGDVTSAVATANALSGTLGIAGGGTGATTAGAALTALGGDNASNLTTGTVSPGLLGSGFVDALADIAGGLCTANQILKNSGGTSWVCATDLQGGGGATWDLTDTDATPILQVDSGEQVQFIGTLPVTVVAAADVLNHDVTIAVNEATTGALGVVQLAGNLGGTGASPTVTGVTCTDCLDDTQISTHADTSLAADLEEETHAGEHSVGGGDTITVTNLASACTDAQVLGGTAAGTGVECQTDAQGTTTVGDCTGAACFSGSSGTVLTFEDTPSDATITYNATDDRFDFSHPISTAAGASGGALTLFEASPGTDFLRIQAENSIATSATLTWAAYGQCTGTAGGVLTIDATGNIVCADDDVGTPGSGDIETVGDCTSGNCFVDGVNNGTALVYEGATINTNQTTLTFTGDPGGAFTVTIPNETGTIVTTGSTQAVSEGMIENAAVGPAQVNQDATNWTWINGSVWNFGDARLEVPNTTVVSLSAISPTAGRIAIVNDASTDSTCTVGGGTTYVLCMANGSAWEPAGDAGPASSPAYGTIGNAVAGSASDALTTSDSPSVAIQTTNGAPDVIEASFNYANSLVGNPQLLAGQCVFSSSIGGNTGGLICEGDTADTNEYAFLFPNMTGPDRTDTLSVDGHTHASITGNYVEAITGGAGIAASAGGVGATVTVSTDLLVAVDGAGATSNNSGMEFGDTGADKLALLQGCADNEILKWNDGTAVWSCATDTGGTTLHAPGADGDSSTVNSPSGLELITGAVTMLRGCDDGQLLKWDETADIWQCAADAGGTPTGGTNVRVPLLTWATLPGNNGAAYFSTLATETTNDRFPAMVLVMTDDNTNDACLHTQFEVPANYNNNADLVFVWSSAGTTNTVDFDINYAVIADGASMDPSADTGTLTTNVTLSGSAHQRRTTTLDLTDAHFAASRTVQLTMCRDADGGTATETVALFEVRFEYDATN